MAVEISPVNLYIDLKTRQLSTQMATLPHGSSSVVDGRILRLQAAKVLHEVFVAPVARSIVRRQILHSVQDDLVDVLNSKGASELEQLGSGWIERTRIGLDALQELGYRREAIAKMRADLDSHLAY